MNRDIEKSFAARYPRCIFRQFSGVADIVETPASSRRVPEAVFHENRLWEREGEREKGEGRRVKGEG
jgi:hypothetical protein